MVFFVILGCIKIKLGILISSLSDSTSFIENKIFEEILFRYIVVTDVFSYKNSFIWSDVKTGLEMLK